LLLFDIIELKIVICTFTELNFIHREIGLLRDENKHQNQEIDMLKDMLRMQNHPSEQSTDHENMAEGLSHLKRPARLLPLKVLLGERKNGTDKPAVRRFYGPPTNCSELSELGYTLNGFYLVKAPENNVTAIKDNDKIQVEVISCAFKHPEGIYNRSKIIEKKASINYLNSKSSNNSGIHFRARLASNMEATKSTNILFDRIVLNHGDGSYNPKTGHFTIPKSGIYQITFSGLIRGPSATRPLSDLNYLFVMVNNGHYDWFEGNQIIDSQYSNQVLLVTKKLRQGHNISIFIELYGNDTKVELKRAASFGCSLLELVD